MSDMIVMVPLDGSTAALAALPVAKAFAELEDGIVHIVHVTQRSVPLSELADDLGLSTDKLEGTVLDPEFGPPAAGILRAVADHRAAFLVLSTHAGELRDDRVIGSTALEVIRSAPCPVVLVHPERDTTEWSLRSLLVGHDGRPATSVAIRPAADLASRAQADLQILHSAGPGCQTSLEPGSLPAPRYVDQPQHEWPSWTREFAQRFFADALCDVPHVHVALAHGAPGAQIVRRAEQQQVDLIVLAWGGDWSEEHAPTIKAVLRDAPCPVMIVRTETAELARPTVRRHARSIRHRAHPA